ncbi:PaRep2a protein [Pyrobaculum aerophilum]|uniref:PaRep2a protein n=1 Tax=Pyrobaculum aerophilum TaxID=13773 RepID=UPI0030B8E594
MSLARAKTCLTENDIPFVLYPSPRRTSWWDWERLGVPTSCLIVAYDAFCKVGRAKVKFRVICGGRRMSRPLYRERIKIAERGGA